MLIKTTKHQQEVKIQMFAQKRISKYSAHKTTGKGYTKISIRIFIPPVALQLWPSLPLFYPTVSNKAQEAGVPTGNSIL